MQTHFTDIRKFRKAARNSGHSHPIIVAYYEGDLAGQRGVNHDLKSTRYQINPYPPGIRHDAWEYGRFNLAGGSWTGTPYQKHIDKVLNGFHRHAYRHN